MEVFKSAIFSGPLLYVESFSLLLIGVGMKATFSQHKWDLGGNMNNIRVAECCSPFQGGNSKIDLDLDLDLDLQAHLREGRADLASFSSSSI